MMIRLRACFLAIVVSLTIGSGCASAQVSDRPITSGNFYVDPMSSAALAIIDHPEEAPTLDRLASTPQAIWLSPTYPPSSIGAEVRSDVDDAAQQNAIPVIVTYAIPYRDCGSFSAGGFGTAAEYTTWVDHVASGIGNRKALVIIEPDALTDTSCLSPEQDAERTGLLRHAVNVLSAQVNTAVYIDGGHSRWLGATELASRLEAVDVNRATGFSLNVSNFFTTAEEETYGESVSALIGGKTYVIDTSRNGAGPPPDGPLNWCNPPDRKLGSAPTTRTQAPHADAYLWVKHPGESDGSCNRGEPPSSTWWNAYAVAIVRNSERRNQRPDDRRARACV